MSAIHTALPPDPVMIATRLPFGSLQKRKGRGDVEHVVEVFAADDAVMAEHRVVDRARLRQRPGMRGGGAATGVGAADLGEDQRLAGLRGLVGDLRGNASAGGCLRDRP